MGSFHLFRKREFWSFYGTMFLGAFNDNFFKNALVILITFQAGEIWGFSPEQMVALCGGIFILPFFLFSATAGQIADKLSKSRVLKVVKLFEILVMMIAVYGFQKGQIELLVFVLFLMGTQSAFFGPAKYSVLPQILDDKQLVEGNALVFTGTNIAILLGVIFGGIGIASSFGGSAVSFGVIFFAAMGFLFSLFIPPITASQPHLKVDYNIFTPTWKILKISSRSKSVFFSILGISWFWFYGAAFLSLLPVYVKNYLFGNEAVATFCLALFLLGTGFGSLLCGMFSRGRLELGLVPIGSIGVTLAILDLAWIGAPFPRDIEHLRGISEVIQSAPGIRVVVDLFLLSSFSGLYIVPLYALIQLRSEEKERSRVIAANNILNSLFMVSSAILLMALFGLGLSIPQIFLVLAILNAVVALFIYSALPEFLMRCVAWLIARLMYRLKIVGSENIPKTGPALLVSNHVSLIDWLIIASGSNRPPRFVMEKIWADGSFSDWFFREAKVIPIATAKEDPKLKEAAFQQIREELLAGSLVSFFPEGGISKDGTLGEFRPGIERILRETPVPVVPIGLNGLWGSYFSRKWNGKPFSKPFARFRARINMRIGKPLKPEEQDRHTLKKEVEKLLTP